MDQGEVLFVNLAKGQIGEDSALLLGGLLVTTIGLAALSRAELQPSGRRGFFVHVDEFQTFTTLALANLFPELRKYRVGLTVAHQYLHQLEPDVRHAILGNVGSYYYLQSRRRGYPVPSPRIPSKIRGDGSFAVAELPHLPQANDRRDAIETLQRCYA
jgi:hypothetical protein